MKLQTEWVRYEVQGQPVRGYFARPAATPEPLPGVVVIQEAFGVDPFIYPGTAHAFFNDTRGNYKAGASRGAWARTLSFLATSLAS